MKRALILGCGGTDGSHLADLLLSLGYDVHGTYRRSSIDNLSRIRGILDRITLHRGELQDGGRIDAIIRRVKPDEIYNEADQDHVGFSKETPQVSIDITAGAVQRLLESVRTIDKSIKVFQPVSATMFGNNLDGIQSETTPFAPGSPYACAKVAAYYLCQHYRREHGLFVSCGIMFNHESPRRGADYLLQRIIREAREVKEGKRQKIEICNGDMKVDIGYAPEYMNAAYRIMQLDTPDDFVVATGQATSIRELCISALVCVGCNIFPEVLIADTANSNYLNEPNLLGNWGKLSRLTGWKPTTYRRNLVRALVGETQ